MAEAMLRAALIFLLLAAAGPAQAAADEIDPAASAALLDIARRAAATGDFTTAASYARTAAKAGHGAALALLAEFHETGIGVPRDAARAAALYRKALIAGFNPAAARLGYLTLNGIGIERDAAQAQHWFRRAALFLSGLPDRAGFLKDWMGRRGVPDGLRRALGWAVRVRASSARERYALSVKYRKGEGVPRDAAMAGHLLSGTFYQGVPAADFYNALALLTAHPGRAKIALGVDLLHAAAAAGYADAQKALAMRHLAGKDVDKSDVAAFYWLQRAKAAGADVGRALYRLERYISPADRKMAEWRLRENFVPEVD